MNVDDKPLTFASYSSASLPSGSFLFFPEWHAGAEDSKSAEREKAGDVLCVVIKASTQRHRLQGAVVGNTLHVVLDNTRFRRLAMELRVRRLKEEPITFSFGLNECRALARLSVDGKDLLEHARKAAWRG